MAWWWYLVLVTIDLIRAENLFDGGGGGGFLVDPFLELTAGVTTPTNQKINKLDSSCVSNGTLAGSIIATLLLSAFIAFLTWMIYLRQKLQGLFIFLIIKSCLISPIELKSYENQGKKYIRTSPQTNRIIPSISKSNKKQPTNDGLFILDI